MTHTAKRIWAGKYEYRGYEIEDMTAHSEYTLWNIRHLSEDSAHDAANTLKDAKALIDGWLEKEAAA